MTVNRSRPPGRFACSWPTAAVAAVAATAVVLLVWLSPSLRVVAGPVEIVHTQPPLPLSCDTPSS